MADGGTEYRAGSGVRPALGETLIAVGALMVTGAWNAIMQSLQGWIASVVTII